MKQILEPSTNEHIKRSTPLKNFKERPTKTFRLCVPSDCSKPTDPALLITEFHSILYFQLITSFKSTCDILLWFYGQINRRNSSHFSNNCELTVKRSIQCKCKLIYWGHERFPHALLCENSENESINTLIQLFFIRNKRHREQVEINNSWQHTADIRTSFYTLNPCLTMFDSC